MNSQPFSAAIAVAVVASSLMVACGGSGGNGTSGQGNLTVSLSYAAEDHGLWLPMTQAAGLNDLGSNTPICVLASGSLPEGVSVDASSCAIKGTPTQLGTFPFTVNLTVAGFSGSVTASGTVFVHPPAISYVGQPITGQLQWKSASVSTVSWIGHQPVAGDTVSFRVADGALPLGLSLAADTGAIDGTWRGFGLPPVEILASITHNGLTVDATSGRMTLLGILPSVSYGIGTSIGQVGIALSIPPPKFSDGSDVALGYAGTFAVDLAAVQSCVSPQALPPGLTLNPTTGAIDGVPAQPFNGCVQVAYLITAPDAAGLRGWISPPLSVAP